VGFCLSGHSPTPNLERASHKLQHQIKVSRDPVDIHTTLLPPLRQAVATYSAIMARMTGYIKPVFSPVSKQFGTKQRKWHARMHLAELVVEVWSFPFILC
jgi:hypothetical protein